MSRTNDLGFVHRFVPTHLSSSRPVTLFLLHGTGSDENDFCHWDNNSGQALRDSASAGKSSKTACLGSFPGPRRGYLTSPI